MRAGIARGMMSQFGDNGLPKYIWAVDDAGEVYEAKTKPSHETQFHGYRLGDDNGLHFTDPAGGARSPAEIKQMMASQQPFRAHAFELACARNDIDHRLTKPKHPWTNGQVERMNRTIKEATVKRFFYEAHDQLAPAAGLAAAIALWCAHKHYEKDYARFGAADGA